MTTKLQSLLRTKNIHVLDTDSARGFIVVIEQKYVLKFCILGNNYNDLSDLNKFPTTFQEFNKEANVQRRIYSLTGICPPVLDTKILNNALALDMFWLISKRCASNENHNCTVMFNALQETFTQDPNLLCGIIVMPYLTGVTFKETLSWPIDKQRQITANCIKNVLSLYRNAHLIHGDLHETNIIVDPVTLECQFIDFGVVEHVARPVLGTVTQKYLVDFLHRIEPWLEFLSGNSTFYKIGANRKRVYEPELLSMVLN